MSFIGGSGASGPTETADDGGEIRTIALFLKRLGKQPDDMLRFFDRKDYYTLHGRDADTVATEYFKSSAALRYVGSGEDRQPYLSINKKMATEVIRTALVDQRRRVEIYKLDRTSWLLDRKGSPGNLQAFEDECMGHGMDHTSPTIVAVRLGKTAGSKGYAGNQRLVGVAFVDCAQRSIRVSEFEDDEHLSNLESIVCQQGTRECVLSPEMSEVERAKTEEVMELCEVPSSVGKGGSFNTKDYEQDFRRLLGRQELHGRVFESDRQLAVGACCGLIKYLDLMGKSDTHAQWKLEWVDAAQYMRLDSGAMRALSVEPLPGEPDKNASLLGIFGQCKTAMGSRLMRKWLKQPLLSAYDITMRHDLVEAFARGFETRSLLRDDVLPKMGGDLDRLSRKLAARKGSLQEIAIRPR